MNQKLAILLCVSFLFGLQSVGQNIEFVENKGQWDAQVKFMGRVSSGAFYVHQDGFTVLQYSPKDFEAVTASLHHHGDKLSKEQDELTVHAHSYRVRFAGGAANPEIIADKPLNNRNNYLVGDDPSKWAGNCKVYQGITVKNIYPNIDIRYYSNGGSVKYDLIVHPGGNPNDIALQYQGADGLEVKNKELLIKTSVGTLKELNPYTYQYNQAGRMSIPARYSVRNNLVKFSLQDYDPKTTLVIDPDLVFCSFSGSTQDNWGFTATYGPDGSMYGGGIAFGAGNFPVSPGAYQTGFKGGEFGDIAIIKLTPDGTNRVYATYIGGSGNDQPHSLIVDPQGELIIAGRSNSGDYPVGPGGLEGKGGGYDIVVSKLSADGSTLVGSKKIGGIGDDGVNITTSENQVSLSRNYGDNGRSEVIIDGAGNVYVASCTQSTSGTALELFPTKNAFQAAPVSNAKQDGVFLKFNPTLSTMLISSLMGGAGDDAAYVLSINPLNSNIYLAGGTTSNNLPGSTTGTIGPSNSGPPNSPSIDGFVAIITPGGTLLKTTYLGTAAIDQVYGIQFDDNGFPYVMGQSLGSWPVVNAPWSMPNAHQFIAKLQPDLSAYVYSTVFGTNQALPNISPVAFLVDRCENVYISGWGAKIGPFASAGVGGLPVTPDALKSTPDLGPSGSGEDFYFFVLKRDAASQLYGSFFGQNGGAFPDHVDGGTSRFDRDGVIYQAICASCESFVPFPTTPGVWSPTKPSSGCNLAMVKIAFNLAGVKGDVRPSINGVPRDSVGCVPLTVDFTDTIQQASQYEWNFGDGSPGVATTVPTTTHTYNVVGSYKVMMIAIDPTKCIPRDTSYVTVKVGDNIALPDFNAVKLSPPCDTFRYRFDNLSVAPPTVPFKSQSFIWDFGDNSPKLVTGPGPVFHTYANAGSYKVRLIVNDTAYCNSPDSIVKDVRVAANVKAIFKTPAAGCSPYNAVFDNRSEGGAQFIWDFGDGTAPVTLTGNPTYTYNNPGTYVVKLTAIDSNTCNVIDSSLFTITVNPFPVALFSATAPQVNTPVTFTNLSSTDANRFKWVFGDGDSLLTSSRAAIVHEFNLTQTYSTCLTAYNRFECAAQFCQPIQNTVDPAIDVPNAFTPLSGDINNKIFVRGFGISKVQFAIYARWGEKVFETTDKRIGWDGRYKGKLLPMDVYAYTLDVELVDGRKVRKTGDITLIR